MIDEYRAKLYCKEDISKIKNYEQAVNDTTQTWECHHMTETWWNCTRQELIDNECYYNRKACELIFLTSVEHRSLHMKDKPSRRKGKTRSVFGKEFKEHFGLTKSDNKKLYKKEYDFYNYHGKFSWEVN